MFSGQTWQWDDRAWKAGCVSQTGWDTSGAVRPLALPRAAPLGWARVAMHWGAGGHTHRVSQHLVPPLLGVSFLLPLRTSLLGLRPRNTPGSWRAPAPRTLAVAGEVGRRRCREAACSPVPGVSPVTELEPRPVVLRCPCSRYHAASTSGTHLSLLFLTSKRESARSRLECRLRCSHAPRLEDLCPEAQSLQTWARSSGCPTPACGRLTVSSGSAWPKRRSVVSPNLFAPCRWSRYTVPPFTQLLGAASDFPLT